MQLLGFVLTNGNRREKRLWEKKCSPNKMVANGISTFGVSSYNLGVTHKHMNLVSTCGSSSHRSVYSFNRIMLIRRRRHRDRSIGQVFLLRWKRPMFFYAAGLTIFWWSAVPWWNRSTQRPGLDQLCDVSRDYPDLKLPRKGWNSTEMDHLKRFYSQMYSYLLICFLTFLDFLSWLIPLACANGYGQRLSLCASLWGPSWWL